MLHLITGYAGYEHITSADQRAFNAAFFGDGQNVLEFGNQFKAEIIDNNTVRILDGEGLMFGAHFRSEPNTYEDVTIKTGTAGTNRIDLICATYRKNETDGTEQTYFEVIEGTEASSPKVPAYTTGNLLEGATFNQMPLYKANISGISLTSVEPMFTTIPTYKKLAEQAKQQFENAVAQKSANLVLKNELDAAIANKMNIIQATTANDDMDVILKSGKHCAVYAVNESTKNTPFDKGVTTLLGGHIFSFAASSLFGKQVAFLNGSNYVYERSNNNGTVSEWVQNSNSLGGVVTGRTTYETTNQQPITFDMPNAEIGVKPSTVQVSMLAVRDKNDAIIGKFQVAQHITGVTETVVGATDKTGTANLSIGITDTGKKYCHFNSEPIITNAGGDFTGVVHAKTNKREITYGTGEVINCSVRVKGGGSAASTSFLRFDRK